MEAGRRLAEPREALTSDEGRRPLVQPPILTKTASIVYEDADARLEFGLELLLDALERRIG